MVDMGFVCCQQRVPGKALQCMPIAIDRARETDI